MIVVYRRYAGLYFVFGIDKSDNPLIVLDLIHMWVEMMDEYFGSVCELDLVYNFHSAYYILDELILAGQHQVGCYSFENWVRPNACVLTNSSTTGSEEECHTVRNMPAG